MNGVNIDMRKISFRGVYFVEAPVAYFGTTLSFSRIYSVGSWDD
jgi:hypothetical protein